MKRYFVKVYNSVGSYITTWDDASFNSFKQTINGGLGQMTINLARTFDNFGEDDDVKLNNQVKLYVVDSETGSAGRNIYTGYISAYRPFIDGHNEGVEITALGYVTKLKKTWLKGSTSTIPYAISSKDCAQAVADLIDNYRAGTGNPTGSGAMNAKINYSWGANGSIPATAGNTISYTFALDSHFEALERIRRLAPANWWFYVGADNLVQFKSKPPRATHTFIFGKDFKRIEVFKNMENIVNDVYFWNGLQDTDANIIKSRYSDTASVTNYDQSFDQRTDGRVKVQATANGYGNALLAEQKDPEVRTVVEILDNNGEISGYDIESIQVGDTCNFRGFNTATQNLFDDNAVIYGVTYEPDKVILEIESFQASLAREVDKIDLQLEESNKNDANSLA